MAGRLAPFIELGVGFNPELTARENVVLNGVMMGLTRREAQRRLDAVLDFAELEEFVDLKLKNYSSGMMVRLAFSVMVQADADIMLIDEVLAVGDAAFAQKCMDVFREKRAAGQTIVLVTHDMATVQGFCDRAMLLHDGELRYVGDPEEAALRYYRLNFDGAPTRGADRRRPPACPDVNVAAGRRLARGRRRRAGRQHRAGRRRSGCDVVFEARQRARRRRCSASTSSTPTARRSSASTGRWSRGRPARADRAPGERVRDRRPSRTGCCPGRYSSTAGSRATASQGDLALHVLQLLDFVVFGTRPGRGTSSSTPTSTSSRSEAPSRERRTALELREVRGPSALGGGWRRALELLYLIAATEFKRTYFGTALGYLWSLARPLVLFAVLLAVFTQVVPTRLAGAELSGAAAVQHRAVLASSRRPPSRRSPRSSARSRSCARRSSRGS